MTRRAEITKDLPMAAQLGEQSGRKRKPIERVVLMRVQVGKDDARFYLFR